MGVHPSKAELEVVCQGHLTDSLRQHFSWCRDCRHKVWDQLEDLMKVFDAIKECELEDHITKEEWTLARRGKAQQIPAERHRHVDVCRNCQNANHINKQGALGWERG